MCKRNKLLEREEEEATEEGARRFLKRESRRVKPTTTTTGETKEKRKRLGGGEDPGANRRPFERAGPHTVRPLVRSAVPLLFVLVKYRCQGPELY